MSKSTDTRKNKNTRKRGGVHGHAKASNTTQNHSYSLHNMENKSISFFPEIHSVFQTSQGKQSIRLRI
jgi:hypothetical protein